MKKSKPLPYICEVCEEPCLCQFGCATCGRMSGGCCTHIDNTNYCCECDPAEEDEDDDDE